MKNGVSAFTLVELLAVVSIVLIMSAIIVPTVGKVKEHATEAECVSRLRGLGATVQIFAADHDGLLPTNTKDSPFNPSGDPTGTTRGRMYNLLGPYLKPDSTAQNVNYSEEKTFRCPTHDSEGLEQVVRRHYKFNDLITRSDAAGVIRDTLAVPTPQAVIVRPNETPLAWDVSGSTGVGSSTFYADEKAIKFGFHGPTSPLGLSPNHGRRCNILFVSGRVTPADLSNFDNFPWNGKTPAKSPLNTPFDPRYAGN